MSLYNMIFGSGNPEVNHLLFGLLSVGQAEPIRSGDFGRFRSIYATETHIVVYTRNGGGNREYYQDVFDKMSKHPLYDYDEDDDFDYTYASIYFRHPPGSEAILKELAKGMTPPAEQWQALFDSFQSK